jgi:xylose isomerase
MPNGEYRFSFGPWNISEGGDMFGPPVRKPVPFARKLKLLKQLGFGGIQLHDDDAVPDLDDKSHAEIVKDAKKLGKILDDEGIKCEFIAPRLWFSPRTIDGAFTSNDPKCRKYALDRTKIAIDILNILGVGGLVLWFAREGTWIRESKDPVKQTLLLRDALNACLGFDPAVRILIEPKPNEPLDSAIIPTAGHALALGYLTADPARVGCLIETAHSILAGLDPSDDMGFALAHGKLWSVHLNDQGGLKFDQDKAFGAYNLRHAFNQVRVLEEHGYGRNGEWVGFDVKPMRAQPGKEPVQHLANSLATFKLILEKVNTLDRKLEAHLIESRDYEQLDGYILRHLMGK